MTEPEKNNLKNKSEKELGLFDLLLLSLKDLADLLQDIRFAAILLAVTAFATLFGTVLPQSSLPVGTLDPSMSEAFGENLYLKLIKPLGLDHVFKTVWYRFVLILLVFSVTLCAWARMKTVIALSKIKNAITSEKGIKTQKNFGSHEFHDKESALKWIDSEIKSRGFKLIREEKDDEVHFFGRKNLLSKWMLVAMHFSFVLILIGAIIGGLFGWKDMISIGEGETWSRGEGYGSVKLVDYWMEFDTKDFTDDLSLFMKMPSDYKSHLQMMDESGQVTGEKVIEVNYPLEFDGLKFYQSAWAFEPIFFVYKNGQINERFAVKKDKPFTISDTEIVLFVPAQQIVSGWKIITDKTGDHQKEEIPPTCLIYELLIHEQEGGQTPVHPLEKAGNGTGVFKKGERIEFESGDDKYELSFEGMNEYTILEVKRDPGVGVVFLGFLICVVGATWGLMLPYGTTRAIVQKLKGKWIVYWGVSLSGVADSIRKNMTK